MVNSFDLRVCQSRTTWPRERQKIDVNGKKPKSFLDTLKR